MLQVSKVVQKLFTFHGEYSGPLKITAHVILALGNISLLESLTYIIASILYICLYDLTYASELEMLYDKCSHTKIYVLKITV